MARIRTIKPELWEDEKLGHLSVHARLLFVGLISHSDDQGRLRGAPAKISATVFPYDEFTTRKVGAWLAELESAGMIVRYEADGQRFIYLPNFLDHQKIDKPSESRLPPPRGVEPSPNAPGTLPDSSPNDPGGVPEESGSSPVALAPSRARAGSRIKDQGRDQEEEADASSVESTSRLDENREIRELFAYWQQRTKHPQAKLTEERKAKLRARLRENYTPDQIRVGIDGAATNPPDRDGVVFDDLASVCRNGGQLERYMERAGSRQVVPEQGDHRSWAANYGNGGSAA